jgi:hypothetical protein
MTEPYIQFEDGGLITAEDQNRLQCMIHDNIEESATKVEGKVKDGSVIAKEAISAQTAQDALKFDGKNGDQWRNFLNQNYVKVAENTYRRFIRKLTKDRPSTVLEHNLGRIPAIDTLKLEPVVDEDEDGANPELITGEIKNAKAIIYFVETEGDEYGLKVGGQHLGDPIDTWLQDLQIEVDGSKSFKALFASIKKAMGTDKPNHDISIHYTNFVKDSCCNNSVDHLKKEGTWEHLRVAMRPVKCALGTDSPLVERSNLPCIKATHIDSNRIYIDAETYLQETEIDDIDLMFLVRA